MSNSAVSSPNGAKQGFGAIFSRDLTASIVVFLVAMPLCMGIAVASGVPAERGLITGIIGGIVVGALAGSPLQVSGPAAGLAVIVFEIVAKHGLQKNPLTSVASWWHSDADLGRVIENFTDMTKSRDLGFTAYQNSVRSFTDAFDKLRKAKVLPG